MDAIKSMSVFCRNLRQSKSGCRFFLWSATVALSLLFISTTSCSNIEQEEKLEQVTHRLGILEDTQAIRNLQHAYGYYIDKCLYEDVVDLFADDGEVHFFGSIYRGKEQGVRRLYVGNFLQGFTGGKPGPVYGFLLDHPQLQDVIHVAPDRKTAKARFRSVMQAGSHESSPSAKAAIERGETPMVWWEGGIYENTRHTGDGHPLPCLDKCLRKNVPLHRRQRDPRRLHRDTCQCSTRMHVAGFELPGCLREFLNDESPVPTSPQALDERRKL